jgi:hypothetical protein
LCDCLPLDKASALRAKQTGLQMGEKDVAIQIAVHALKVEAPAPPVPGAEQTMSGYPSGMPITIQVRSSSS